MVAARQPEPHEQASALEPAKRERIAGNFIQQTGLNCSTAILGSAYTEVMVSGSASYGGLPSVPKVNDPYWTALLVAIPRANPCGSGSSNVVTTLILPPSTQRSNELADPLLGAAAGQQPGHALAGPGPPELELPGLERPLLPDAADDLAVPPGRTEFGFRPLANGQFFWIFVPVKSSAPLIGAGAPSPGHGFTWLTDATGVYANPGRELRVGERLPAGTPSNPFIYFAREPAAVPFWKANPNPAGTGEPR